MMETTTYPTMPPNESKAACKIDTRRQAASISLSLEG